MTMKSNNDINVLSKALIGIRGKFYSGQIEANDFPEVYRELIDVINAILTDFRKVKNDSLRFKTALMHDIDIMSEALEEVSKNNLTVSIPDVQLIEMGNIQVGILEMIDALKDYRNMEEEHSRTLEMKVEERTRELKAARDIAEEATRSKSEFLANMSHEIRTPLNAIMGLSNLSLKTSLTEKQRDYLTKIDISARNLLGIINDILDFSKIEAGKLVMDSHNFDLFEVMDNLANMFSGKSAEKGIELVISVSPDVPRFLIGDPLRLGQVLINLVSNSLKFTDSGEVVVKVELIEKLNGRAELKFSVRDTGIGIEPAKLPDLFMAFIQADGSTTRQYGGTGLGLAISKRIVEMMEGRIWAESDKGKGSCFQFTALFKCQSVEKAYPNIIPRDLQDLRTLVVEDNEAARVILKEILESFHFDVSTANSGTDALHKLSADRATSYELIMMDWMMPDMDGIEVIKKIRQHEKYAHIPIILMTAFGREELMVNAEKAGASAFLFKPLKQSLLFDTIMEVLGRKGAAFQKDEEVIDKDYERAEHIKGAHVLLVEDNAINQLVAMEILKKAGIVVSVANNGEEAVTMFKQFAYDAILMDVQMPVMDGFAATRAIRGIESEMPLRHERPDVGSQNGVVEKRDRPAEIPIIAMTAHAMKGDREKCISEGMNDYVTKPIDIDKLFKVLGRWMRKDVKTVSPDEGPAGIEVSAPEEDLPRGLPGIDMESALRRLDGNKRLFKDLLLEFKRDYAGVLDDLRGALRIGDIEAAQRIAHTIKGVAGNLSAKDLMAASGSLEIGIRDGNMEDMDLLMERFEQGIHVIFDAAQLLEDKEGRTVQADKTHMETPTLANELNKLAGMLRAQDMDAEDCLESVKQNICDIDCQGDLEELEGLIGRLDFENARTALNNLAGKMGIALENE